MENASKALLMAAGVLIGIVIVSLGVYLFFVFGNYASNTQSKIDSTQVAQFNDKFMKYNGLTDLTIQDIITAKNYALENNNKYSNYRSEDDACRANDNNDYIDIYYGETKATIKLILNTSDEELLKNENLRIQAQIDKGEEANAKRFTCEIKVNFNTGRVNKVYFYATK